MELLSEPNHTPGLKEPSDRVGLQKTFDVEGASGPTWGPTRQLSNVKLETAKRPFPLVRLGLRVLEGRVMRDHGGSEWAPLQLANTAHRPSRSGICPPPQKIVVGAWVEHAVTRPIGSWGRDVGRSTGARGQRILRNRSRESARERVNRVKTFEIAEMKCV
eukprot:COSAG02_NODE_68_length_42582_cov_52.351129_24_plen_161_part_00